MTICSKNILIFGIESLRMLAKNLIANLSITKNFKKQNRSHCDEARDFYAKKYLKQALIKAGPNID